MPTQSNPTKRTNRVPQFHQMPVADARRAFEAAQTAPITIEPAGIHQQWIPGYKGEPLSIWIVRPKQASGLVPAVMYFHGGGFVLGSFETHERLVRDLVAASGMGFVFVDYSRAPEAQFPRAIEECYSATRYIAEHGEEFGLDGSHLAVAGDCAGANLATVVTLLAKYRGGPPLRGQLLLAPMLDATLSMPSDRATPGHPPFTMDAAEAYWRAYTPDAAQRSHPMVSPVLASAGLLRGLPSACLLLGENDAVRPEGEAYAAKLEEANVPVTVVTYLGCAHDFLLRNSLAGRLGARDALAVAAQFLNGAMAGAPAVSTMQTYRPVPMQTLASIAAAE